MKSQNKSISLGFSNKRLNPGTHICLIYRDEKERQEIVSKFLRSGLINHEKIGYFTDIMAVNELTQWCKEMGIEIPVSDDPHHQQFEITSALNHYCPHGQFTPQHALDAMCQYYEVSVKEGFSGVRVTGETSWLFKSKGISGTEQFIIYEAMLNKALKKHPVLTMCQYDANLISGAELFDVLQVHPFMIVHGQIVENPTYLKPDEFIQLYKNRT
nr:MEDS domain-containing protein [Legionella pneumophila]